MCNLQCSSSYTTVGTALIQNKTHNIRSKARVCVFYNVWDSTSNQGSTYQWCQQGHVFGSLSLFPFSYNKAHCIQYLQAEIHPGFNWKVNGKNNKPQTDLLKLNKKHLCQAIIKKKKRKKRNLHVLTRHWKDYLNGLWKVLSYRNLSCLPFCSFCSHPEFRDK